MLAGGCYDGLAESLGGPATACAGWAAGVDRLNLLREMPIETAISVAVRNLHIAKLENLFSLSKDTSCFD